MRMRDGGSEGSRKDKKVKFPFKIFVPDFGPAGGGVGRLS